ncbi:MAG TPA: family 10 glycosylhydrolase [Longimicrobiales bacterium]
MMRCGLLTAATLTALAACAPRLEPYASRMTPEKYEPPAEHTAVPVIAEVPVSAADPVSPYYETAAPVALPQIAREFRGVWVATVHNMDWPSRRDLTTAEAQRELIRILDTARDLGLNAVIFQVRPAGDALYASSLEPWSEFLTGSQGRAPEPYWDPLEFAVREAHARGLELHAWFNPFRAGFVSRRTAPAATHVMRRQPEIVRRYGTHYWMDPAEPAARQQALAVISDVVRRYDIDAVHLDDYFYPYRERDSRGRLIDFPDGATWQKYGARTGLNRGDWRRATIDQFVEQLYHTVRGIKPHVRVGISPFGIWRPGHPATVRGLDAYVELFADSRKWLVNGWADYYAPQLYWRTYAPQQDYATLLRWWSEQNPHGRHIWAGNIPNSVRGGGRGWDASEILEQIRLTRAEPGASGNIHFSASGLLRNADGLADAFRRQVYSEPALVPAAPWLSPGRPIRPPLTIEHHAETAATRVRFDYGAVRPARLILHTRSGEEWHTRLLSGSAREVSIEWRNGEPPDVIAVSAVDRTGVEGEQAVYVRAGTERAGQY